MKAKEKKRVFNKVNNGGLIKVVIVLLLQVVYCGMCVYRLNTFHDYIELPFTLWYALGTQQKLNIGNGPIHSCSCFQGPKNYNKLRDNPKNCIAVTMRLVSLYLSLNSLTKGIAIIVL